MVSATETEMTSLEIIIIQFYWIEFSQIRNLKNAPQDTYMYSQLIQIRQTDWPRLKTDDVCQSMIQQQEKNLLTFFTIHFPFGPWRTGRENLFVFSDHWGNNKLIFQKKIIKCCKMFWFAYWILTRWECIDKWDLMTWFGVNFTHQSTNEQLLSRRGTSTRVSEVVNLNW